MADDDKKSYRLETRLGHVGRDPLNYNGVVNPPVYHASTILSPDMETYQSSNEYGRIGTTTTRAVEAAAAALEGGEQAVSFPSGLAAVAGALLPFVSAGDHLLVADNIYLPTRRFCDDILKRYGVEIQYFDPLLGSEVRNLFRPETKAIYFESPGSQSFEVMDVPAVCGVAHDNNIMAIMDNTWSAGIYFKPFDYGVDVVVQAATKYFSGHADAMLGFVISEKKYGVAIKTTAIRFGTCAGPDVCYMGLRGLRTLGVRMPRHYESGLKLAEWLSARPEVDKVLHPAMAQCPGHEFWKRDFLGASGLFGVVLHPRSYPAVAAMIDDLQLFGLGNSWGGYESLLVPINPKEFRTVTDWPYVGPCLRIHAGLEDVDDLIDDLSDGLDRLTRV
jgi:cystathionine beta-lyase